MGINKLIIKLFSILPLPVLTSLVSIYLKLKKLLHNIRRTERLELDKNRVPFVNYKNIQGRNIGIQRNPVTISQTALSYYEDYIKNKNEKSKNYFLNNVNWLVKNSKQQDNYAILYYHFPWPKYNLDAPWCSAMAQGQAIQTLILAHQITKQKTYLDTARLLLNSFFVSVEDGGVTHKDNNNCWWYEEFAEKNGLRSRVLNGMMFALLGIYDYYKYTSEKNAKFLFDQGIRALKKDLPQYDFNSYSYYDILKNPAGKYHLIHIEQLKRLYEITNEKIFENYHEKWKKFNYYKQLASSIFRENRF